MPKTCLVLNVFVVLITMHCMCCRAGYKKLFMPNVFVVLMAVYLHVYREGYQKLFVHALWSLLMHTRLCGSTG